MGARRTTRAIGSPGADEFDALTEQTIKDIGDGQSYKQRRKDELKESSDKYKQIKTNRKLDEAEEEAVDILKELSKSNYKKITNEDLIPGSMLLFKNYNAKDKTVAYDKTPLALIIGSQHKSNYVLGLNVHWLPKVQRKTLITGLIKKYRNDIKRGKKPNINYRQIKNFLYNIGAQYCIRLYIKNRISKQGIIIPPDQMLKVIMLPTESITNGKTAEFLYKKAIMAAKKGKKKKGSRIRGKKL